MKDLILITTYNRPQYLWLCLEALSHADGIADKEVWLFQDRGTGPWLMDLYAVVNEWREKFPIRVTVREPHTYHGNTYNTLEAYKEAYTSDAKFVYLVEDDVLVQPDFFQWHEAVQVEGDFMASIGYRCRRNSEARTDVSDAAAYFTTARDFASIGVCWRREKLAPIIEHARPEYYRDLAGYLAHRYPRNRFGNAYNEQDGLIMRVMAETGGVTAWGYLPRAWHIGFSGYNRPKGPILTLAELQDTIHDADKVRMADRDFGDIERIPLTPQPQCGNLLSKLYRLQHFA